MRLRPYCGKACARASEKARRRFNQTVISRIVDATARLPKLGVPAAVRRALQRVAVRIRRSGGLHETELEPEPNNSAANWRERERI